MLGGRKDQMPHKDAWRDYRRRRMVFVLSFAAVPACAVWSVGSGAEGSSGLMVLLVACVIVLLTGSWFATVPCPACGHEWFGANEGASLEDIYRLGLMGNWVGLAARKLCGHCGLPKFMAPAGWHRGTEG